MPTKTFGLAELSFFDFFGYVSPIVGELIEAADFPSKCPRLKLQQTLSFPEGGALICT